MENYDQLTALQIENDALRAENQKLNSQNATKDDYISKLEEKINCMEKYITELEKENQSKGRKKRICNTGLFCLAIHPVLIYNTLWFLNKNFRL